MYVVIVFYFSYFHVLTLSFFFSFLSVGGGVWVSEWVGGWVNVRVVCLCVCVSVCVERSTWPFLIEYLCLTCVNKKLTKEWMYFFLDDAERTGMYPKKII